jgi:PAS domain S-box-containing protein
LLEIFPGDSDMSRLMRSKDWSATPLGPPELWPESLKAPLRLMLTSRFEMWLGWGPELLFFYNDAYVPTLGLKHPRALASPTERVWPEIYEALRGRFTSVMRDGVATWDKALLLLLERSGYPEETYHTFSYSPIWGAGGTVEGLLCIVSEETDRVISERRLGTLGDLANALLPARTRQQVRDAVLATLATNTHDFPFAALHYLDEADGGQASAGPLSARLRTETITRAPTAGLVEDPPLGAWDAPARDVLIVPIAKSSQDAQVAALLLALNPYAQRGDDLTGFAQLVAGQIASAVDLADAHLREAEETERLRQLFAQSPSFIAVLRGPDHRFELANNGYQQLIAHRDVIGLKVRDALPEIEGQGFFELLDEVYRTGRTHVGQAAPVVLQRAPGAPVEERFLDFVYQPIRNAGGEITGIFVEGIDVTTAHTAVRALRDSEAQFRTLAQALPNQVWTARPDGELDWFNELTYSYSGKTPGQLDGFHWTQIVHPDDLEQAAARWTAAVALGTLYDTEFRLQRADGVFRWHVARAVPLRDASGAISRWVGTNTDIEDQKATAEALAELNATLEQQVAERTGELMAVEETLRQSQKMEAVGQLTGGIAHDFNNMLGVIVGSLDLLGRRIDADDARSSRYLKAAIEGAERATVLTQRLLAFSRQQPLQPEPIEPNRLVSSMSEMLAHALGGAVVLQTVLSAGVWRIHVDPNQLENVILNLAVNARDAMDDSGRLTIETQNAHIDDRYAANHLGLTAGQYVLIAVTDTGAGMPESVIARAFDPFFTTKEVGKGTGLGLSQVYGFVKQSGGHVKIYSEVGQGTSVKIYLPRYAGAEPVASERDQASVLLTGDATDVVLVVEDDDAMREFSVAALGELGYRVHEAASAAHALRLLEAHPEIKLLFTDVVMPGVNGAKLAAEALQQRPDLKVLYTTGYTRNAVVHNGVLDAGVDLIGKPFTVEALAMKVREVLDAPPRDAA